MMVQHFIGLSAGKDSQLTAQRAIKRFEKRGYGNMPPRFFACDTGNEYFKEGQEGWSEFIHYLERAYGISIEIWRADFTEQLATRRTNIRGDWSQEKRIRKHSAECKARRGIMPFKQRKAMCQCPEKVYPPVPDHLIDRAISLLHPTGNPFLDLCLVKGRFPGMKSRFCTEELKIAPIMAVQQPLLDSGVNVVSWVGERAEESADRRKKPVIQRIRHLSGATQVLYRPIHGLTEEQVFAEIAQEGYRVNPLYSLGAKRVGCWPCAFCGKDEVQIVKSKTPERIDLLREWEALVGMVSRRGRATFFHAPDEWKDGIDAIVEWSATSRGGRQFDMFQARHLNSNLANSCARSAGLCE